MNDDQWAGVVIRKDSGFKGRWSGGYVPAGYPGTDAVFQDWTHDEQSRVLQVIAEIECAKHGHIICPAADDGCCNGDECYECGAPFSRDEHKRLMREQNGRDCDCS